MATEPGIDLIVSSRHPDRAREVASELRLLNPGASITGVSIDQRSGGLEGRLAKLSAFLVLYTAGPYQEQDYRVAEACIRAGSHYLDLADSREFVCESRAGRGGPRKVSRRNGVTG